MSETAQAFKSAADVLRRGGLVAFPTETVYGLGADAASDAAVARIFEAKMRPRFNPLIIHVADLAAAARLGEFTPAARALAQAFWPGALTLVVARRKGCPVSRLAGAGLDTIALRVPAHPLAQALLAAFGGPVAAPSANRSGGLSPTTAEHVRAALGSTPVHVIDGGPTPVGVESTIVDCTGDRPRLLRPGGITREDLAKALGTPLAAGATGDAAPSAPGQLRSHYAPRAGLRLHAQDVRAGEALLAFGPALAHDGAMRNLSEAGNLREAAANLFGHLHELDATGAETIAVMPIPDKGLGEAINDRLRRAAAPRTQGAMN